jgi:hypothetical protein
MNILVAAVGIWSLFLVAVMSRIVTEKPIFETLLFFNFIINIACLIYLGWQ